MKPHILYYKFKPWQRQTAECQQIVVKVTTVRGMADGPFCVSEIGSSCKRWVNNGQMGSSMDHEIYNVQASRKEYHWKSMSNSKGLVVVYVENGAVEVLDLKQSQQIHQRLKQVGETSKCDAAEVGYDRQKRRSEDRKNRWLPKKYSSRLVVPWL